MRTTIKHWEWVHSALLVILLLPAYGVAAQDDGIKVHGHWKFEIFRQDGTLDRVVEFDNALISLGNSKLVEILARKGSVGRWRIAVNSSGSEAPCTDQGAASICIIQEGPDPMETYQFGGLTVGTDTPSDPTKLVLSGSMVVGASVSSSKGIGLVQTALKLCAPGTSTTDCASDASTSGMTQITAKALDSEVMVQPGQTVQITVEISFS